MKLAAQLSNVVTYTHTHTHTHTSESCPQDYIWVTAPFSSTSYRASLHCSSKDSLPNVAAYSGQRTLTRRSSSFQTGRYAPFGPLPRHRHRHQSTQLQAKHTSVQTHNVRLTYVHRYLTCDALLCSTNESSLKKVIRDRATNTLFRKSTIATESSNSIRTKDSKQS